jgi:prepilin-type N-terminal cleavage/methylation domain
MKSNRRPLQAFTLIELLVVISIIAILASLAIPAVTGALSRGQMTQTLSNMKQLHQIAYTMSMDATTTGDTNVGWPGDMPNKTWAGWITNAVPGYLKTNDMAKLLSAPGITVPPTATLSSLAPGVNDGRAVVLYQVAETNNNTTVLFSSSNFTNSSSGGETLSANSLPYGEKGFIVFRKGGDGSVLQARQVGSTFTNVIGDFAAAAD